MITQNFRITCDLCGREDRTTTGWTTIQHEPAVVTIGREEYEHVCPRCRPRFLCALSQLATEAVA